MDKTPEIELLGECCGRESGCVSDRSEWLRNKKIATSNPTDKRKPVNISLKEKSLWMRNVSFCVIASQLLLTAELRY